MSKNKILLAALAAWILVSFLLSLAHVNAGDAGGGGSHGIIKALFL